MRVEISLRLQDAGASVAADVDFEMHEDPGKDAVIQAAKEEFEELLEELFERLEMQQ